MAAYYGLTEFVASHGLSKALAPDGHLPTAMRRHDGSAIDIGGNLGDGKGLRPAPTQWRQAPATPLGNASQIRRGWMEGGRGWAIAPAL